MPRIIAGFAKSHRISVPRTGTRPTSERVREAIFSALEARNSVKDSLVLDLYAGTGALGLEAASRGARSVTLVEKNPVAARIIAKNVEVIRKAAAKSNVVPEPQITVVVENVISFLRSHQKEFDLVFLDPPYNLDENELHGTLRLLKNQLHPDALAILERSSRSEQLELEGYFDLQKKNTYGETELCWLRPAQNRSI